MDAEQRLPAERNEGRITALVHEPERVDAESFHHAEAARDRAIGHDPHDHVHRFRMTEMKSQNVSWAEAAWGISLWGSGLTAWMRSGNFTASWMKKTGMLFPTRSKLPSSV